MQGQPEAADPSAVGMSLVIELRPFPDVFAYGSLGAADHGPGRSGRTGGS
jgi:hypothetical protein